MMHEAVGTRLDVVTGQGRSTYRIEGVRRAGDDVPAPPAQGQGQLTLITAAGDGRLGGLRPDELVYVDASLQSKPFPAGGQRVNTLGQSELAMANDTSVLPLLALTLGGLLVALVGMLLLRRRLRPALVWTVFAPVFLALAWFAADLSVHLIPNLV